MKYTIEYMTKYNSEPFEDWYKSSSYERCLQVAIVNMQRLNHFQAFNIKKVTDK